MYMFRYPLVGAAHRGLRYYLVQCSLVSAWTIEYHDNPDAPGICKIGQLLCCSDRIQPNQDGNRRVEQKAAAPRSLSLIRSVLTRYDHIRLNQSTFLLIIAQHRLLDRIASLKILRTYSIY